MRGFLARTAKEPVIVFVALAYLVGLIAAPAKTFHALATGVATFLSVLPIIIAVFSALGLLGVILDKQRVGKRFGERFGVGVIALALGFGAILVGPVFAVFPLLKTFKEHGARWAVVVTVITASGAKLPFLPLEVQSLGWRFALLRLVLTMVAAVGLGLMVDAAMTRAGVSARVLPG